MKTHPMGEHDKDICCTLYVFFPASVPHFYSPYRLSGVALWGILVVQKRSYCICWIIREFVDALSLFCGVINHTERSCSVTPASSEDAASFKQSPIHIVLLGRAYYYPLCFTLSAFHTSGFTLFYPTVLTPRISWNSIIDADASGSSLVLNTWVRVRVP